MGFQSNHHLIHFFFSHLEQKTKKKKTPVFLGLPGSARQLDSDRCSDRDRLGTRHWIYHLQLLITSEPQYLSHRLHNRVDVHWCWSGD